MERQTDKQIDRKKERQMNRSMHSQMGRYTFSQMEDRGSGQLDEKIDVKLLAKYKYVGNNMDILNKKNLNLILIKIEKSGGS